ncbi:Alpha/Beta hydrolase protein [Podospora conica]|nr:Alpha/Beta hydrolase protein [Schizothecium conicum]
MLNEKTTGKDVDCNVLRTSDEVRKSWKVPLKYEDVAGFPAHSLDLGCYHISSQPPRPGQPLLVLIHGYGSHEGDLVGLVPHLTSELATVSIQAPLPAGMGYATDAVIAWLDDAVPGTTPVALLGFSQGGLMVTHLIRTRPDRFFAGVVLSGFVADTVVPGDEPLAKLAPPVFFGHGNRDPIVTGEAFARS